MGDFKDEIKSGDRRRALTALRDQIADKIDAGICTHCGGPRGEASGLAALSLRLMRVMDELDAIPAEGEVSSRDAIARDRQRRRESAAKDPA